MIFKICKTKTRLAWRLLFCDIRVLLLLQKQALCACKISLYFCKSLCFAQIMAFLQESNPVRVMSNLLVTDVI